MNIISMTLVTQLKLQIKYLQMNVLVEYNYVFLTILRNWFMHINTFVLCSKKNTSSTFLYLLFVFTFFIYHKQCFKYSRYISNKFFLSKLKMTYTLEVKGEKKKKKNTINIKRMYARASRIKYLERWIKKIYFISNNHIQSLQQKHC